MAGQTADLLRNAAQALGATTAKLDDVLEWQRHLADEMHQLRERVKGIETRLEVEKEWHGEERRSVKDRLATGDHTFDSIREMAKQAQQDAKTAQELLKKVLERKEDGTKRRPRWMEVLKVAAPYVFPALVSALGAVWFYLKAGIKGGP